MRVHMWAYTSNSAVRIHSVVLYIGKLGMHRYGNGSGGIWPELSQTNYEIMNRKSSTSLPDIPSYRRIPIDLPPVGCR